MPVTRYDLGLEFSGGLAMPTVEECEASMIAVATLDAVGEPSLTYHPATDVITADDTLATALAPTLRGVGLTVDANGNLAPRLRMRRLQMRDQFISGGIASGSIGQLNWSLLGSGTPAAARSGITTTLGNSQKLVLSTSGSANDRTVLCLGDTESRNIVIASEIKILQTQGRLPSLTDRRWFFGLSADLGTEPSAMTDGLGIYYDSAVSPNYQVIARSSSSGNPVNTGVAVPSNSGELITLYQPAAGTFQFYSGNTLIGTIGSGLPTAGLNIGYRLETLAAAVKSCHLGGFILDASTDAAATPADDDTFLEV